MQFLERARDPEIAASKQSLVDVSCKDQAGNEYIIEIQIGGEPGFEKRAQYYSAKMYAEQHQEVIFIAITDYLVFPEAVKSDLILVDKREQGSDLKNLYFTYIELPKFNKGARELETGLDYWCYYLKHAPETKPADYDRLIANSPIIKRAYEALDPYYWSEAELNTYEQWVKAERDSRGIERQKLLDAEARVMEKGVEKGMEQEKLEIAKNMLKKGLDVALICEMTGLSEEQINQLQKS